MDRKDNITPKDPADNSKENGVVFVWLTKDGQRHTKTIFGYDERLDFITWLETASDVVWWR